MATNPTQFTRMLQGAIQNSYSKQCVSVLAMPSDLTFEEADNYSPYKAFKTDSRIIPSIEELNLLADLLNEPNKKIPLFCGIGCKAAHDEIINLPFTLNAPVLSHLRGNIVVVFGVRNVVCL